MNVCHDCGVQEGQFHKPGCDMEHCPFCGHQLISCDCCYERLGLFDHEKYTAATAFLSPEVYTIGLNKKQSARWQEMLEAVGLVPYIRYPNICQRCGEVNPELFMVPNTEWKHYIEISQRGVVLCRECYDEIKRLIYNGRRDLEAPPTE